MGKRTPVCGVGNKDPAAAAAAEAQEEVHSGFSKQTVGKLRPPHT